MFMALVAPVVSLVIFYVRLQRFHDMWSRLVATALLKFEGVQFNFFGACACADGATEQYHV